jgi:hypothetical protein
MELVLLVSIGLFYNLLVGGLLYLVGVSLIANKAKPKFYEIVPLYPKPKYSVVLYTIASVLYTLISLEGAGGILVSLFCVIIASQFTRGIAKLRKEDLEESFEEEIERKRRMWG